MKNFKQYINENYDVYLDMPEKKKYRAKLKMKDEKGNEHHFPIGSDDNVRSAAHKVVKGLAEKGLKLIDIEYEF